MSHTEKEQSKGMTYIKSEMTENNHYCFFSKI